MNLPSATPENFNFATDVLDRWARERPDAPGLWCVDAATGAERRFSFRELAALSRRAAHFFRASGIRRGDPVMVMLPRVPEWWLAMLGLIRLGAVPVPATLLLAAREVAYRLAAADIRAVVTNGDGMGKLGSFAGLRMLVGEGVEAGLNPNTEAERGARPPRAPFSAPSRKTPAAGDCGQIWNSPKAESAVREGASSDARGGRAPRASEFGLNFTAGLQATPDDFQTEPTRADDPALIFVTSATTGDPKMVLHTQASYGLGHRLTGDLWLDLRPEDVHWNISDLGWGKAAWSSFYGPWHAGTCIFALDQHGKFDPVSVLKTLAHFPITTWCAPPTALRLIVREDLTRWRFPHLRHCVTAGEPLNPEVLRLWHAATGLTLHEGYGQTETVVLIGHFRSLGGEVRPGSMGRAAPGFDIALLDDDLQEVPTGREGEIAVRVKPQRPVGLFQRYWQNDAETADRFRGDWYLTNDRAVRDADGYFWFVGRQDDVIKSSGYRIGPFEVESALLEHPAVLDVAVVGKPDEMRGQIVKAFVIPRPSFLPDEALKHELQSHCKRTAAPYKYPREVEFVTELPKTTSGKTRRFELRRRGAATA